MIDLQINQFNSPKVRCAIDTHPDQSNKRIPSLDRGVILPEKRGKFRRDIASLRIMDVIAD